MHLPTEVAQIHVYYKWDFDDSGGYTIYKHTFINNPKYSSSHNMIRTIAPLEMLVIHIIFWKNLNSSLTNYCRTLCFMLVKENYETPKHIFDTIVQQKQDLNSTNILLYEEEHSQFKHI